MAEPPDHRDPEPQASRRWLRVLVIVAAIALLLILVVRLVGGGEHGPARHSAAAFGAVADDHTQAREAKVSR